MAIAACFIQSMAKASNRAVNGDFSPRDVDLADAVGRTIQTRPPRVDEDPVLAGVEMPPTRSR